MMIVDERLEMSQSFVSMVLLAIEEGCCTVRISPPGMVNRNRMITFLNMPA